MTAELEAHRAVAEAARDSRQRLIAFLSARSHDVAAAEDALAEAFQAALETWPRLGVPARPEAWLLTAARRRLIDGVRHAHVVAESLSSLLTVADEAMDVAAGDADFPDERLKLMFVCAHPAIDATARTPLMLQTVLGLDAARIASAFLVKPSAMSQRLTRAKTKIRDAGMSYEVPEARELPARLDAVLEAIYAAYGSGWDDIAGADARRKGLAREAIELGRLLDHLLPENPETQGLLALMLFCEARRAARRTPSADYVPLAEQDPGLWSMPLISEAAERLLRASQAQTCGRFQLEAAIQSVHAQRIETGRTDWPAIALLYEGLVRLAPTLGAQLGRIAAIAEAFRPAAAWAELEKLPEAPCRGYQPYWALKAHLLKRLSRQEDAQRAYGHAIGLSTDAVTRAFLMRQMSD